MVYCSNCGHQIKNNSLFCPKCGNRVGVTINVQKQYSQPFQLQEQKPFKPNSYMAFALLTTFGFCLPIGLYAVTLANKVDGLYYSGEYEKAEMVAKDAKKWSIIGLVVAICFWIVFLCVFILLAVFVDGFWEGFLNALFS